MHSLTIVHLDAHYILVRKPAGRASSRWSSFSLLDAVQEQTDPLRIIQREIFWPHDEYGLLNRLDNETTGIMIFARSLKSKEHYHKLQDEWKVIKTYYASVYGEMPWTFGWIKTPIYHHRDDPSRMTTDPAKGRGQGQEVITYREKVWESKSMNEWETEGTLPTGRQVKDGKIYHDGYNKQENLSISQSLSLSFLRLQIEVGCRHQIRCHLASIGHPIIGDSLYTGDFWKKYCKKRDISLSSSLDLVSAGIDIND